MVDIKFNLQKVLLEIRQTEKNCSRKENSVKLCAVSKFHPSSCVEEAFNAGQMLFGENRVQEAEQKFSELNNKNIFPELHIIGSLQRNKVKNAVKIATCIQSVDRIELLEEIEKQCAKIEKNINILFELHTGEESKSGFKDYEELYNVCKLFVEQKFSHVKPLGLMTMAPNTTNEKLIRNSFEKTRKTLEQLNNDFVGLNLKELSMGMSGDFKIAIEEGSTIVRIGTSIFGERNY